MIKIVPLQQKEENKCYLLHHKHYEIGSITYKDDEFSVWIDHFFKSFKSLEEAEDFAGRHLDEVLGDLVQILFDNWESHVHKHIPCLAYFDSKYEFRRVKGGWQIHNELTQKNVGSLGRGKYGHAYALYINGLGLTYKAGDLDDVKERTVAVLNGKEDLRDLYYNTWRGLIIQNAKKITLLSLSYLNGYDEFLYK